jgi:hypothetical protein
MRYHGAEIYSEDAMDEAPSRAVIRRILSTMKYETQNRMILLACSGIRPVDLQHIAYSDLKWDEHPVRLIVPPKGKTKRGWETFITDELAERLKTQRGMHPSRETLWTSGVSTVRLSSSFQESVRKHSDLSVIGRRSERGRQYHRYRLHLYSLKKFFFSQVTAEVGDAVAHAWCGRKAYLSNYLRLSVEERRRLYLRCMPRLTVFASEPPKTEDRLRLRLRERGIGDEVITEVLEGLDLPLRRGPSSGPWDWKDRKTKGYGFTRKI